MSERAKGKKSPGKKSPGKIAGIIICCLVGLVLLAVVGFYAYIHIRYAPFFDHARAEFETPGTYDGLVAQGIGYVDDQDVWLVSGYDAKGGPSPVYIHHADGSDEVRYFTLPDGSVFFGHNNLATDGTYLFLTDHDEQCLWVFSLEEVLSASDGASVQALGSLPMPQRPDYVHCANGKLYCGEFCDDDQYPTADSHHITVPDGTDNNAILLVFEPDESAEFGYSATPSRAISTTQFIQGMCFDADGNFVLSQSFALRSSHLLFYDASAFDCAVSETIDVEGNPVPLYVLKGSDLVKSVECPPMGEEIVQHEGRIYIANEAACSKYYYGRIYGAQTIYSYA